MLRMRRFFDELVAFLADDVLPGGRDAIHGYDINLDETTPHIQIIADTFGDDPKHEGQLRVMASHAWSSHRDVLDEDGRQKSGPAKLRGYQRGLRERMIACGFDVEREVDADHSTESFDKPTYVALDNKKRKLDALVAVAERDSDELWSERRDIRAERATLARQQEALNERRASLDLIKRELDDRSRSADERDADQHLQWDQIAAQRVDVQRRLLELGRQTEKVERELQEIIADARQTTVVTHDDENLPHVVWRYLKQNPKVAEHFDAWARRGASVINASAGPGSATALNTTAGDPFETHKRRLQRARQSLRGVTASFDDPARLGSDLEDRQC